MAAPSVNNNLLPRRVNRCSRCGKRPGLLFGLTVLGLRAQSHEARCLKRSILKAASEGIRAATAEKAKDRQLAPAHGTRRKSKEKKIGEPVAVSAEVTARDPLFLVAAVAEGCDIALKTDSEHLLGKNLLPTTTVGLNNGSEVNIAIKMRRATDVPTAPVQRTKAHNSAQPCPSVGRFRLDFDADSDSIMLRIRFDPNEMMELMPSTECSRSECMTNAGESRNPSTTASSPVHRAVAKDADENLSMESASTRADDEAR